MIEHLNIHEVKAVPVSYLLAVGKPVDEFEETRRGAKYGTSERHQSESYACRLPYKPLSVLHFLSISAKNNGTE
jgi:hypothetical protein